MMFSIAKAAFMVEILLAELIFLFPAQKRSLFALRYPGLFALCILIGGFFPIGFLTRGTTKRQTKNRLLPVFASG